VDAAPSDSAGAILSSSGPLETIIGASYYSSKWPALVARQLAGARARAG
jgi:hypothetical protein